MNPTKHKTISIVIVSNNHLVQLGLQQIVETSLCMRVVGQCIGDARAEQLVRQEKPDVILIDMDPHVDVVGLIRRLKAALQSCKIVLLSDFDDKERTREAFVSGVDGVVLKVQPPAVLVATIEYLCPTTNVAEKPILRGGEMEGKPALPSTAVDPYAIKWPTALTEREREVVVLIGQGLSNKDIADKLCISGITVRHHLTSIFDKLGVTSRQKLLIRAHQYGLVALTASA